METVKEMGVKKEKGFLYFVDKQGDVSRARMLHGRNKPKGPQEKIATAGVRREPGYLYFVDKQGNISRSPMKRGRGS